MRRIHGLTGLLSTFVVALSTPTRLSDRRFVPFHSCDCPVEVKGVSESNCSLQCSRMPGSPRFQLRNCPICNLPRNVVFLYTGITRAAVPRISSPVRESVGEPWTAVFREQRGGRHWPAVRNLDISNCIHYYRHQ